MERSGGKVILRCGMGIFKQESSYNFTFSLFDLSLFIFIGQ